MTQDRHGRDADGPAQEAEVGSVAEEAVKLLGALREWAGEAGADHVDAAARGLGELSSPLSDHVGHGQDCRYCPVCQGIRIVRETSPEVREHLASAIGSLAEAATAALRQTAPTPRPDHGGAPGPRKVDLDD